MTHRFVFYVEGKFSDGTGRYAARCGHNLTEVLSGLVREMEKYPGCDWETLVIRENVPRDPNWLNAAREAAPKPLSPAGFSASPRPDLNHP